MPAPSLALFISYVWTNPLGQYGYGNGTYVVVNDVPLTIEVIREVEKYLMAKENSTIIILNFQKLEG